MRAVQRFRVRRVTLVNVATNISREATTSDTGEFIFLEVPVGTYEIDVTQTGFKKFVRKDISVDLNAVISVDIALQSAARRKQWRLRVNRRSSIRLRRNWARL